MKNKSFVTKLFLMIGTILPLAAIRAQAVPLYGMPNPDSSTEGLAGKAFTTVVAVAIPIVLLVGIFIYFKKSKKK